MPRAWAALGVTVTMAAAVGVAAAGPASAEGSGPPAAFVTDPVTPFSLVSKANSEFVTADNAGSSQLLSNRTRLGPWEQFTLVGNADGTVSLRANVNGKLVTNNGGANPLIADRTAVGLWEEFLLVPNDDGTISLQAVVNGLFVTTTQAGGTGPLVANNAGHATAQTHFYRAAMPVASILTAQANGTNVTVDRNTRRISATANDNTRLTERFVLFDAGDGLYALRSEGSKGFVSADTNGNVPLVADRSTIGLWEKFTLVYNDDGTISLRALVNNMYVTATGPGNMGPLTPSGPTIAAGPNSPQRFTLRGFPSPQNAALKSNLNAGYVTAGPPGSPLAADGTSAAGALGLRFSFATDGTMTLTDAAGTPVNGEPVAGIGLRLRNGGGTTPLTFTPVHNTDGTVSVLCHQNGRYLGLASLSGSGADLVAESDTIGAAEKFVLISQG
ncbi:hypothetical protein [Planosporangium mesophilum]|uniref:hypothetical protein n=1 Tax=Planosporangium mesophilum TaxID=689768 RepID=UPI00143B453A|nr:hypothetical protein [Planosporangium mesophilum]NJC83230.1 hypothetical protein [Planosporangium mesophilum]